MLRYLVMYHSDVQIETSDYIGLLDARERYGIAVRSLKRAIDRQTIPHVKIGSLELVKITELESDLANKPKGSRPKSTKSEK